MDFRVVIPARFDSKRLPGKVLADIAGKPMIQRVYERAMQSGAESVIIATDDKRIRDVAESFGAAVCMTSAEHQSGTERIAEAVGIMDYDVEDIVVNLQADEPLIAPESILSVAQDLELHDNVKVTTLCEPIENVDELFNTDVVKVVVNRRNYAMYFSRAAIPWERDSFRDRSQIQLRGDHFRHIGLFAYRVGFLEDYVSWPSCPVENMERLEQLRIIWNGTRIHVSVSKQKMPAGVDTQADLDRVVKYIIENKID